MHCFSYMIQIRKTLEHICDKISSSVILLIRTSALPLFSLVSSSIVKKKRKKKGLEFLTWGALLLEIHEVRSITRD